MLYVLQTGREFRNYVINYTNAFTIIREGIRDTEELGGLFSGWHETSKEYDSDSWMYQESRVGVEDYTKRGGGKFQPRNDKGEEDRTLQHPRCVYQLLKKHFARYTLEMVERACGVPREQFLTVVEAFISASGPEKTGAMAYALGWTQQSEGVQIIRTAAILQLLLGNIGCPGGGILALRGHASIQGSTDIATLYDIQNTAGNRIELISERTSNLPRVDLTTADSFNAVDPRGEATGVQK